MTVDALRQVGQVTQEFLRLDTNEWTATGNTQKSAPNGVTLLSTTVSTNNSLAAMRRAYNWAQFRDDKPLHIRFMLKYAETVLNGITNFCVGVSSETAANMLQNDGAGPAPSWTGAVFYAVDGSPLLRCRSQVGTTYQETVLNWPIETGNNLAREVVKASSPSQRVYEVETRKDGPSLIRIDFIVDKLLIAQHRLVTTNAALMGELVAVRSGDASANVQVVEVDMINPYATR
jgi:hypothetical protein